MKYLLDTNTCIGWLRLSQPKIVSRIKLEIPSDLAICSVLGIPIGPNDSMIAPIALAHGLILVTHNTSEFSRVPGLFIEDWQLN